MISFREGGRPCGARAGAVTKELECGEGSPSTLVEQDEPRGCGSARGAAAGVSPPASPGRPKELMASHELPRREGAARSLKPAIAGVLLLIAASAGFVTSGRYIGAPHLPWLLGSHGELTGEIKNESGGGIQNATVCVLELRTVSNETGYFRLSGVPTGRQEVVVEADGYKKLRFITLVYEAPVKLSLKLKEGNGTEVVDEHPQQVSSLYTCGALTLVFSVVALGGAFSAMRRKRYTIALTGAMVGLALPPFPIATVLCLTAIALLIFSRGEFG
ncbi:MAG: carboxypeptidase-like regulatory domain-containing protein [Thermoplasmata archaeon]